jgi:hypothetical protein
MPAMTTIAPAAARLASEGVAYAPQIASAAARNGLDPTLLAAVAAQETGGPGSNAGRNVVGDGGHGRGLFQIDDRFHAFARSAAAMDPARSAGYAAGMLSGLLRRYGGNVRKALSAYNAGDPHATGSLTTWPDGSRLGYADSVMRHYDALAQGSSALDEARAEQSQTSSGVNTLLSQALAKPLLAAPSFPQRTRWHARGGLDATGHPRDGEALAFDTSVPDEGDD